MLCKLFRFIDRECSKHLLKRGKPVSSSQGLSPADHPPPETSQMLTAFPPLMSETYFSISPLFLPLHYSPEIITFFNINKSLQNQMIPSTKQGTDIKFKVENSPKGSVLAVYEPKSPQGPSTRDIFNTVGCMRYHR